MRAGSGPGPGAADPCCRCGHRKLAHQHYRCGTDCALCDRTRFRRVFPRWLRVLLR